MKNVGTAASFFLSPRFQLTKPTAGGILKGAASVQKCMTSTIRKSTRNCSIRKPNVSTATKISRLRICPIIRTVVI